MIISWYGWILPFKSERRLYCESFLIVDIIHANVLIFCKELNYAYGCTFKKHRGFIPFSTNKFAKTILIWLIDSSIGSSFEVIIVCATICQVGSIEKQREETTNHINYIVEKKIRVKN